MAINCKADLDGRPADDCGMASESIRSSALNMNVGATGKKLMAPSVDDAVARRYETGEVRRGLLDFLTPRSFLDCLAYQL